MNKCLFAKGWCQTCGKSESTGHALCYYEDPFFFPKKKKRFEGVNCLIIPYRKSVRANVSKTDRAFIYERDNNKCLCCDSEDALTIDHIIPVSKGGKNEIKNYQTLCFDCNTSKSDSIRNYVNL